jgi:predicted metal-dependent hydrolase
MASKLKRAPGHLLVAIADREIPVAVKRNSRAKRIILRIDHATRLPVLTMPSRVGTAQGEDFLHRNLEWLESRLNLLAPAVPFRDGGYFPLRGRSCRIYHRGGRGPVRLESSGIWQVLSVPGDAASLSRRVTDWLKAEARRDFEEAVGRYAPTIRRRPHAIRIGDPKSRWGSCSAHGVLTFSWRLVLAPARVLDYVAAHETAHLVEMNHGPRFWALVERLYPNCATARAWLDKEGAALAAVGRPA